MGRVPSPSPPCRSGGGDVVLVPHTLINAVAAIVTTTAAIVTTTSGVSWPPAGKRRRRKGGKRTRGVRRQIYRGGKLSTFMIRSYDPEYTPSRPIWEVKQDSARPVLRTEMTREALVTNLLPPFCTIRPCGRDCPRNRREKRANEAVFGGPSAAVGAPGRVTPRAPVRNEVESAPLAFFFASPFLLPSPPSTSIPHSAFFMIHRYP